MIPWSRHPQRATLALIASLTVVCLLPLLAAGCRDSAPDDLIQQEPTTAALVFVKTSGSETLNRSEAHGNLYKLTPIAPGGVVTPLTNFIGASVSDPAVSFDGKKILFSMRPAGASHRNIWEIHADGTGLRQVTGGGGDDFDPLYLPDDRIAFTSTRAGEMDEYNFSAAATLHTCEADGSGIERISFNQSDDFDPELLPDGRIFYTRWEHFGTFNRFPLFFTNPDGTGTFLEFGPHDRNFFHVTPTPDGRMIAIESTRINGDAGPIAMIKSERGRADPAPEPRSDYWDVLTPQVNTDGEPWSRGAFKYPRSLGGNQYVASYSLPAATAEEADYGLYTFAVNQQGVGTPEDPATFTLKNVSFLYNDPETNEYDAQVLAPRPKPPIIPSIVDRNYDYGVFLASDVYNRGAHDDQERPQRGVDMIDSVAVIAARPTMRGEPNDYSANEFEKRALIGIAPVYPDGSFRIKLPANTPVSVATLDRQGRGFVVKRMHIYLRPGEHENRCIGCHVERTATEHVTNPDPMAAHFPPFDLNIPRRDFTIINYEQTIGPIVAAKCLSCHQPTYSGPDTIPAAGNLDLTSVPDTVRFNRVFPRGYANLSGEAPRTTRQVVTPAFPRRSILIDYLLGLGSRAGAGPHPTGPDSLTAKEKRAFNLWVMLGAQYK